MVFAEIDQGFMSLEQVTGIRYDQLKLLTCLFSSIPFGIIQWAVIRGTTLRHLYSFLLGLLFASIQFGPSGLYEVIFSSMVTYALLVILPRNKVALPVLIFQLCFISYMHIYKMLTAYMSWDMDAVSLQMILTAKLSSLAYCYQDFETFKTHPNMIAKEQRQYIVEKLPNVLEYFSYVCFYPTVLIGPSFEYSDYKRFIEQTNEFKDIPFPLSGSLKVLLKGIIVAVIFKVVSLYFPLEYLVHDDFNNHSFPVRCVLLYVIVEIFRIKYLAGFSFSEAAVIATGFSYNGKNQNNKIKWDRVKSVQMKAYFLAPSFKTIIDSWNISIGIWLRRYIYNRISYSENVENPSSRIKAIAQQATFAVSALWHGFYPGYYVFFILSNQLNDISKWGYTSDFNWVPGISILKYAWWYYCMLIADGIGACFALLSWEYSYKVLSSFYYLQIICLLLTWAAFKGTKYHIKYPKKKDS